MLRTAEVNVSTQLKCDYQLAMFAALMRQKIGARWRHPKVDARHASPPSYRSIISNDRSTDSAEQAVWSTQQNARTTKPTGCLIDHSQSKPGNAVSRRVAIRLLLRARCPIIGSPQKSLPRPTIYRQKSAPPPPGQGETFLGGSDPIMGRLFRSLRCFNKGKTYQFRDYLSSGRFFMGESF